MNGWTAEPKRQWLSAGLIDRGRDYGLLVSGCGYMSEFQDVPRFTARATG